MGTMAKVEKDDDLKVIVRNENEYKLNEKQGNLVYYSPMGFFGAIFLFCFLLFQSKCKCVLFSVPC